MNNKFGSLVADVSKPFKVEIIDPTTESLIRDNTSLNRDGTFAGVAMFINVWSTDSERARNIDKAKRDELRLRIKQSRNGIVKPDDVLEENIAKLAALTDSWHIVDRITGDVIDVPCTVENAADLYSPPGMGWLFAQPWVEANSPANFLPKPSKPSAPMPIPSSGQAES
jgi:hypothetical protein